MSHPPYYNRGATVPINNELYQVEAVLREGKNIMQALKLRKIKRKLRTKTVLDEDVEPFVMKRFRTENQSVVAMRAFEHWQRVRDVLMKSGFPDIVHCDDEINLAQFIEGDDVEKAPQMNVVKISKIVEDIAELIDALLDEDMAHGDIKPANIIIDQSKKARLIDMDYLAPLGKIRIGKPLMSFGIPTFMAPEHVAGEYMRGTDMYSLGKSAFHLLKKSYGIDMTEWLAKYGIPNFPLSAPDPRQIELMSQHLFRNLARKDGENERQSKRLINFITRAMAHDPKGRPQSRKEVSQVLAA